MVELQKHQNEIAGADFQVVGISYDTTEVLKKFADENQIEFRLLSDHHSNTQNKTIRDFQLLDTRESGKYSGVPVPTTVIVNQDKKISFILNDSVQIRHTIKELIQTVKSL